MLKKCQILHHLDASVSEPPFDLTSLTIALPHHLAILLVVFS